VHRERPAAVVDVVGERGHDAGAEGDDGHEVPVHDVDVERTGAGIEEQPNAVAEGAEVGREDRRADLDVSQPRAIRGRRRHHPPR